MKHAVLLVFAVMVVLSASGEDRHRPMLQPITPDLPIEAANPSDGLSEGEATRVAEEPLDFVLASDALTSVEDLFSGGASAGPVVFDVEGAKLRGTDAATIELASELAAYTNDLVRAADAFANGKGPNPMNVAPTEEHMMVRRFFRAATAFHIKEAAYGREGSTGGIQTDGWCKSYLTDAACTCGHWSYPQPSKGAPWKESTSKNPSATLKSWGYHQTPGIAAIGWTRAQTYYPSRCGSGTFRDHAYIKTDGKTIREQNYAGWTPRGEPNPEFWTSWKWPYPAWPTYVQWWHSIY
ncbi:MAG: hypothetical protein M3P06_02160 [Acidobacteriota bacterium]|nr:hypothetical protein [Acidobacteriota bacterium]